MAGIWNADFGGKIADAGTWNADFRKTVPDGAAGNQSQMGIFYDDDRGRIARLVEAEGHEVSYNPEIAETNPIGQEAPSELVRSYRDTFGKDVIVKKGAPNYEFFRRWLELRPTGDNAKLRVYMVNFMEEEAGVSHNKYLAYSYMATCTVESGNYTDGRLAVNFSQDGDRTVGIMQRTDSSASDDPNSFAYGFTPSSRIAVAEVSASDAEIAVPVGGERKAAVSFSPLGSPHDFTVHAGDESVCSAQRVRQSVVIRGRKADKATVTVASAANPTKIAEIEVTVA